MKTVMNNLAEWFDFKGNKTDLKTEIIAGLTTFATMAYMVAVVPGMLSTNETPIPRPLGRGGSFNQGS